MKTCKHTLEQIAVLGSEAACEIAAHLEVCPSCTLVFNETVALEKKLLPPPELDVPTHLKYTILKAAQQQQQNVFATVVRFAFRTVMVVLVVVSGFWLGLQMANSEYEGKVLDFDVAHAEVYQVNTVPTEPTNLGDVYFTVLQEENHVQ